MRLLIVGPPGAGKGTQAEKLAHHFGVPAISTGDIFRSNIEQGTELGKSVESILASGGYVSDDITNEMVRQRLAGADAQEGFLLDGYPRTAAQVTELDTMLGAFDRALDLVVELQVDPEELITRLIQRALVAGRADDTEEVIRKRQAIYLAETAPLLAQYRDRGLLLQVPGSGTVAEVSDRLISTVAAELAERKPT
ncbi:MAG: adenylate kinase [Angustibacter sp.]